MIDRPEETRYSESREASAHPTADCRHVDSLLDGEDLASRIVQPSPFPDLMLATGVLWILAGVLYIGLFGLYRLLRIPFQGGELWLIFGAAFFIKDGIQLIRGRFRDPQADGIISVLLGIVLLAQSYFRFENTGSVWALVYGLFFGVVFLAPGILVLLGRKQYLAWKEQAPDIS